MAATLPTDPAMLPVSYRSNDERPQNMMNEARANNLQSHVSDFFQQISVAGSPEDVMEAAAVPMRNRMFARNEQNKQAELIKTPSCLLPKLTRMARLQARCKTPYRAINKKDAGQQCQQTPLAGRLSSLRLDQDLPEYENVDNAVTEVLNRYETRMGVCVSPFSKDFLLERIYSLISL